MKYKKKMLYYIIIDIIIKNTKNGINSKIKTIGKQRTHVQMFHMKTFYIVNIIKQII